MHRRIRILSLLIIFIIFPSSIASTGIFEIRKYYLIVSIGGSIKNVGEKPVPINETDLLYFDYPLNLSDQKVLGVEAIVNGSRYNYTVEFSDGTASLIVNATDYAEKELYPGQMVSAWVHYNVSVDLAARVKQVVDLFKAKTIEDLAARAGAWSDLKYREGKFLNETRMWNWSNPLVALLYKYLSGKQGAMYKPFTALYTFMEWLDHNIVYSTRIPARHPWEVIVEGAGDCDDQSNLLITLLRRAGIPSFLEIGLIYLGKNYRFEHTEVGGLFHYRFIGGGGHGWLVAYIPPWGWLRVDLTASLGRGIDHVRNAAFYITPIVVTQRVYKGDYATQSAQFTKEIRVERLEYNISLIMTEYQP